MKKYINVGYAIICVLSAIGFFIVHPVAAATYSFWTPSAIPGISAVGDANQVELGIRFMSDIAGYVTGIRFYKGITNVGLHRGRLWTNTGTLLGSVAFSNESASGWQEAVFDSPIAISANTQYIASYHTTSGHYAFDRNYFDSPLDSPPLHAPALTNGVYLYGSGGFPSFTWNASNYWVDIVFSDVPPAPDTIAPIVSLTAPLSGTVVSRTITVSANASDNTGVAGVRFFVDNDILGSEDTSAPYTVTWNTVSAANGDHTLTAVARDTAGNYATSSVITVTVSNGIVPVQGPGGPILIVASESNPFTTYYKEILLAEGYNLYRMMDISAVSAMELANYDVVILGELPLTAAQTVIFTNWVQNGGNLIAMRPDMSLTSLLGISAQGSVLNNAYVRVNTAVPPGIGIVSSPLQFHGTADQYILNGAVELATFYSNLSTSLAIPAVTNRAVGTAGGHAAAFAFDLAHSVVYTRQGNPAWSGQHRSGSMLCSGPCARSVDLFFGNAPFDPQPDWVDLNNVEIPQADEMQRFLANMISDMLASKKPLPRFWYLPRGEKAEIIMTGDDHGNGGTVGRLQQYQAMSAPGCVVANWECIRSTSYMYASTPISDAQAAGFANDGFELSIHPDTNCVDWTPETLDLFFSTQIANWRGIFPSLSAPATLRTHCGTWSDYDTHPQIAFSHGMRLDTNYYYWPGSWYNDRPGLFTGSGMPMRFADRNGNTIDAYQATTQLTDESDQTYPLHVDTLLDNALGPKGYYGMFTVNAHTDNPSSSVSDIVINSALSRGVHVISAKQALDWLDGRNASSFGAVAWNTTLNTLSFTITQDTQARGLTALVPAVFANKSLAILTKNGMSLPFVLVEVKGVAYAQFAGDGGSYQAVYALDTVLPTVSLTAPQPNAIISGIVTVSADAADNIGVSGVQFLLDGINLNQEITAAPYRTSWNTIGIATGTHTLLALARDLAGNRATSTPVTVTVLPLGGLFTLFSPDSVPGIPATRDSQPVELGVRFTVDNDGYAHAVRFYKGLTNTGIHRGNLWTSAGTLLSTVTFVNETASGWQEQAFFSPVPLTANTEYIISYHTDAGNYAFDKNYFTLPQNNPPLHAPAIINGVYRYGSSSFPSFTWNASNYWVDVVVGVGL